MYEPVRTVAPAGVTAAVWQVRQSAAAGRVAAYRAGRAQGAGQAPTGAMAVLVQVMVEAQAAGVAFTADPITGDQAEAVIAAVRGLGERLVGGEATGDEWVVRAGQARCRRSAEDAIDAGQARQIARLARRAEAFFGAPQDVEWAIAAGRVFLVPARPIAAPSDPVTWRPAGHGWRLPTSPPGHPPPHPPTPPFPAWLPPPPARP